MLDCNDVIDLETDEPTRWWDATVFTAIIRPLPNALCLRDTHSDAACCLSFILGFNLSIENGFRWDLLHLYHCINS